MRRPEGDGISIVGPRVFKGPHHLLKSRLWLIIESKTIGPGGTLARNPTFSATVQESVFNEVWQAWMKSPRTEAAGFFNDRVRAALAARSNDPQEHPQKLADSKRRRSAKKTISQEVSEVEYKELLAIAVKCLRKSFSDVSAEEIEDEAREVLDKALNRAAKNPSHHVVNPQGYVYMAAKHQKRELLRRLKRDLIFLAEKSRVEHEDIPNLSAGGDFDPEQALVEKEWRAFLQKKLDDKIYTTIWGLLPADRRPSKSKDKSHLRKIEKDFLAYLKLAGGYRQVVHHLPAFMQHWGAVAQRLFEEWEYHEIESFWPRRHGFPKMKPYHVEQAQDFLLKTYKEWAGSNPNKKLPGRRQLPRNRKRPGRQKIISI